MELGTVIATEDGPTPTEFSFVVTANHDPIPVRKGQFVELETEEGRAMAVVVEVIKTNRYFARAESVKEYERGGSLRSFFPADRWEHMVAKARVMGVQTSLGFERPSCPPSPGQRVLKPSPEDLSRFLGFDQSQGVELGRLRFHDVPVKICPNRLLRKHVAILSMSGAGKSYTSVVMIEELLNRTPEQGRLAVVVIDVHGEYKSLADPRANLRGEVRVIDGREIRVGVPSLSSRQFMEFIPEMSEVQARELERVLIKLKQGREPFGIEELVASVEQDERMSPRSRQALAGWLWGLKSLGVFAEEDEPNLVEVIKPGLAVVVDLSGVLSLRKKQVLVAHIARKLFSARRAERIPPFVLCLEEAHQFCPEGSSISKRVIETLAREGRKFYASLVLISQRPVRLSTTVLSQASTNIILRITNPYDLEHIKRSSEAITSEVADLISSLPVGEALVVGEAVNHPIFVKIRRRLTPEPAHGLELQEAAKQFERLA